VYPCYALTPSHSNPIPFTSPPHNNTPRPLILSPSSFPPPPTTPSPNQSFPSPLSPPFHPRRYTSDLVNPYHIMHFRARPIFDFMVRQGLEAGQAHFIEPKPKGEMPGGYGVFLMRLLGEQLWTGDFKEGRCGPGLFCLFVLFDFFGGFVWGLCGFGAWSLCFLIAWLVGWLVGGLIVCVMDLYVCVFVGLFWMHVCV
jgi:hypothetical protein